MKLSLLTKELESHLPAVSAEKGLSTDAARRCGGTLGLLLMKGTLASLQELTHTQIKLLENSSASGNREVEVHLKKM